MEVDYLSIGKRIRKYRKIKGLTQQELARIIDVDRSYIGHIEQGNKSPGLETVISIANALEITSDELLIDSLEVTNSQIASKADAILLDCSPTEEKILTENMKSLRETLRPFNIK